MKNDQNKQLPLDFTEPPMPDTQLSKKDTVVINLASWSAKNKHKEKLDFYKEVLDSVEKIRM